MTILEIISLIVFIVSIAWIFYGIGYYRGKNDFIDNVKKNIVTKVDGKKLLSILSKPTTHKRLQ